MGKHWRAASIPHKQAKWSCFCMAQLEAALPCMPWPRASPGTGPRRCTRWMSTTCRNTFVGMLHQGMQLVLSLPTVPEAQEFRVRSEDFQSQAQFRLGVADAADMLATQHCASRPDGNGKGQPPATSGGCRISLSGVDAKRSGYFLLGSSSGLTYLTPHGPTPCT